TDMILARAAGGLPWEAMDGETLAQLASTLPAAQADVIGLLGNQGFPVAGLNVFSGEFRAQPGDHYDDLLEHLSASIEASDMSYEDFLEVIAVTDPEEAPVLNNTKILNAAAVVAMPQLNKAALEIEAGALKMSLEDGTNDIGA